MICSFMQAWNMDIMFVYLLKHQEILRNNLWLFVLQFQPVQHRLSFSRQQTRDGSGPIFKQSKITLQRAILSRTFPCKIVNSWMDAHI